MSSRGRLPGNRPEGKKAGEPSSEDLGKFLARELHDSVAQTLAAMLLELQNFRIEQHGRVGALRQIDRLEESTRTALADLRALLVELRHQHPGEMDLVRLIRRGMLERKGRGRSPQFRLQVASNWPERISADAAMELHRIVGEAIDNAIRHGGATKIQVALSFGAGAEPAVITITDDGTGISHEPSVGRGPGFGIMGMRERAGLLGGQISLLAAPSGTGTRVQVTIPVAAVGGSKPRL